MIIMKLSKNILKNSWVLAIMIIVVAGIVNFLVNTFIDMGVVMVAVGTIVAAIFTGQIYFIAFKEVIPKILRLTVALNYLCIQVILLILVIFALGILELWVLALMMMVALIASAVVYWAMGFGRKMQLKSIFAKSL